MNFQEPLVNVKKSWKHSDQAASVKNDQALAFQVEDPLFELAKRNPTSILVKLIALPEEAAIHFGF